MTMFNLFITIVPLIMVFCGCWSFTSKCKHFLNTLLSLKYIMLGICFILSKILSLGGAELYFAWFFLSMAACEGALGLSLLVSVVNTRERLL